jgi:hypothetical protein
MRLPRALHGSASLALPFSAALKNLGVFASWREIPFPASWGEILLAALRVSRAIGHLRYFRPMAFVVVLVEFSFFFVSGHFV